MRRVIYAWDYIEWGGAQIHFLALMKEARKSFETIAVLPKGTDPQFLGFMSAADIHYELFEGHIDAKPKKGILAKLKRHWTRIRAEYSMLCKINNVGIDAVVHTDILPGQSLLSLVWLCLRTNVYITLHNAHPPVPKWRWLLWRMKFGIISMFANFHVFCTNEHAARYYRRLFLKRTADDIKVTYDSINPGEINDASAAFFDRKTELERLDIPTEKFLVLAVGQFVDRKGRWTFLEAAKLVKQTTDDILFVWVCPNLPEEKDRERISRFDLGDAFHLIKSEAIGAERHDILKFFRVADTFVLPSFVEGVPIALLEAMAIGIPSISTNVYGIPEAIIHEKTGLLVEAGNAKALSQSILRLKQDSDLLGKLSRNGREFVLKKFDETIAAQIAVEAYKSTMAGDN